MIHPRGRKSTRKVFCPHRFKSCHILSFHLLFLCLTGGGLGAENKPRPQVSGYFKETATFSFQIQKFPCTHVSVFKSNLPVYTYPTHIRQVSRFTLGILATEHESYTARNLHLTICIDEYRENRVTRLPS